MAIVSGEGPIALGDSAATVVVNPAAPPWYRLAKSVIDRVLAGMLLVLVMPILVLAMVAVRVSSPGAVLYTQTRVGRNARSFNIYKIRSMFHRCEDRSGPVWSPPTGDPRVTPVGRFLRKTHIDELPQLWNVLRGEMSLVGPRPERPEFVRQLKKAFPHYQERLLVRPGLTGLAQIQLPPDTDLASVKQKLACDLYYIKNLDPVMDLQVLICTATYLLGIPFSVPQNLLGVPGIEEIESACQDFAKDRASQLPAASPQVQTV